MTAKYVLSLDQGTTSSRAILYDSQLQQVAVTQEEITQVFPKPGWVEHDPLELWSTIAATARGVIERAGIDVANIASIGVTNQRETVVVWDKNTGQPVHNAIVWQDRRTSALCDDLRHDGLEDTFANRTGLLLDPYFSGTKLKWLLDRNQSLRKRAKAGELLFGTVDTWLVWNLTGGKVHATDATNASRTLLYNTETGKWDEELCAHLGVPIAMLPEVLDCDGDFGRTRSDLFGREIAIRGVAGDQQAAAIGQGCFEPGMIKSTYGTGCFALLNTGDQRVKSTNRLLGTVAYQFNGKRRFALEGSIFVAGAVVQWLRDGLQIIRSASETDGLAKRADETENVIFVPAFTGLGAPYWDAECRGAIYGLTRKTGPAEVSRAALESVGFQTRDLIEAMSKDVQIDRQNLVLRVDGGMSANDWTMQFLSDVTGLNVARPDDVETTAKGAAWLAGQAVGLYPSMDDAGKLWKLDRGFRSNWSKQRRDRRYSEWKDAVWRTLSDTKRSQDS